MEFVTAGRAERRSVGQVALLALLCATVGAAPLRAQADPGGAWRTLETAHFRVHFRPAYRGVGRTAADEAERAWTALAAVLPPPRRRIDLVVADNVDYANGLTTIYPVPTILVYAFPPPGDLQLADYDRWIRLVTTHELTHAFHLDDTRGWWRVVQRIFGRVPGTFPNVYTPTWLTEGIAVFYESKVTGEGRLEGAFHRAVVDARVAEQGPLPMGAAGGITPAWPGGIRPYAFGATFFDYLTRREGDTVMPRLVDAIARRPLPYLQLDGALTRAAGISFTDEWDRWMKELRGRPAAPRDSAVSVVCCRRTSSPPRLSADGRRLLFVREDGRDAPRLAVWDRDRGTLALGPRVNSDEGVAWSGDTILFAQLEFRDPYTIRSDLWTAAGGLRGGVRRLTSGARLREPDVAPDGRVVAVRTRAGTNELVALEAGRVRVLAPARAGVEWATPRFSPGGTRIVAVRVAGGWHDIVLLDTTGALVQRLTDDASVDRTPVFTPDGRAVVWAREVDGSSQIVERRLDDGAEYQVTHEPFGAYAPAPASDSLFYLAYHADGFRLVAVAWPPAPSRADFTSRDTSDHAVPAAPRVAEREHAYSPFPSLLPQYWLPSLVQAGPGTLIGALSSSQDPLGRHAWLADFGIGTGAAAGRWRGSLYYVYAGLPPAVFDAALSRNQHAYYVSQGGQLSTHCCLAEDQAAVGITLLRRRWRSLASARLGGEYDATELFQQRAGVSLTGVLTSVVRAPTAISTQSGFRLAGRVRSRWRRDYPLQATDVLVTGAGYVPGGMIGFARQVLAARVAAGFVGGSDTVTFGVGGPSGGSFELVPGVVVGDGARSFPVRGYPADWIEGRNAASASLELRTPLAMVGGGPPLFPPVTLDRLSTLVFLDAGTAWSSRDCPPTGPAPGAVPATCANAIASAGGELVVDAGVPYDFPVRIRAGVAWRFDLRSAALYGAIGSSF